MAKATVMGGVAGTLLVTGHEMEKKLRDAPVSTIMGGPVGGNCMDVVALLTEVVLNRRLLRSFSIALDFADSNWA